MSDKIDEKEERAAGVSRMLTGEGAPSDTDRQGQVGPTGGGVGVMAPEGVGEKTEGVKGGESMIATDGKEAGRFDTTVHEKTGRQDGESTPRDMTSINAQEGAPSPAGRNN